MSPISKLYGKSIVASMRSKKGPFHIRAAAKIRQKILKLAWKTEKAVKRKPRNREESKP